ncbi:MAG: extracellular solute-binding protein [Gemmatimonadaceae bacterium]
MRRPWIQLLTSLGLLLAGCGEARAPSAEPLVVFTAVSLSRAMRAALDTFARREGLATPAQEVGGSVELARRVTELGRTPDLIVVADPEVFSNYLAPSHVDGWVLFAHNRLVLAYTDRSHHADEISADRWYNLLTRDDVEIGRTDPDQVPIGYRTLLAWQLAERHYAMPRLASRLLSRSPPRNVRPESELVALLQAGELDYVWMYESQARAVGLRMLRLPSAIDLSDPALAAQYAAVSVRIRGNSRDSARGKGTVDSVTITGAPIVYALAIPRAAAHRTESEKLARFLFSADGRAILARERLDLLDTLRTVGTVGAWATPP